MSLFRRKPKRFVAVAIGHGNYRYIDLWAVYLSEKHEYGHYRIPHDIEAAHPELGLDLVMSKNQATRVARFLNRQYPLDSASQEG